MIEVGLEHQDGRHTLEQEGDWTRTDSVDAEQVLGHGKNCPVLGTAWCLVEEGGLSQKGIDNVGTECGNRLGRQNNVVKVKVVKA